MQGNPYHIKRARSSPFAAAAKKAVEADLNLFEHPVKAFSGRHLLKSKKSNHTNAMGNGTTSTSVINSADIYIPNNSSPSPSPTNRTSLSNQQVTLVRQIMQEVQNASDKVRRHVILKFWAD